MILDPIFKTVDIWKGERILDVILYWASDSEPGFPSIDKVTAVVKVPMKAWFGRFLFGKYRELYVRRPGT